MPGMTGTTPTEYATAAAAVSGTGGPETVNQVANAAPAANPDAAAVGGVGAYTVPYALQSGLTKYAPMQSVPPTKITLKNFTPLYSTSKYTVATTWLAKPTILTTLTESQTFSVSSMENTVSVEKYLQARNLADNRHRQPHSPSPQVIWPNSWRGGKTNIASHEGVKEVGIA